MTERRVTRTQKDTHGEILALCNPTEHWSPCPREKAIQDIEFGLHIYYVESDGERSDIEIVHGQDGKYLRSKPDATGANNLGSLPDC